MELFSQNMKIFKKANIQHLVIQENEYSTTSSSEEESYKTILKILKHLYKFTCTKKIKDMIIYLSFPLNAVKSSNPIGITC